MDMIAAVVLAAGLSTRMGKPKLVLPWGSTTVIGQVVATLVQARVDQVVVVTGGARSEIETALSLLRVQTVRTVFNSRYMEDAMLISLQVGMVAQGDGVEAVLVALGDQPQMEVAVVRDLVETYHSGHDPLIVPSHQMRRGHPWLVDRSLWPDILSAPAGSTLRDFLHTHARCITYLPVESPSILGDLDTPQDYKHWQPAHGSIL